VRDEARMIWIPPGQKDKLTKASDIARFSKTISIPLFEAPERVDIDVVAGDGAHEPALLL
jgi:hypothetical protein